MNPIYLLALLLAGPSVKCPSCGALMPLRRVPLFCPQCHHGLRFRHSYFRVLIIFSVLIPALADYALGMRGDALLATVFLGMLPTYFILAFITLLPPDLEATGDYQDILYDTLESTTRLHRWWQRTRPHQQQAFRRLFPRPVTNDGRLRASLFTRSSRW
jgi:hypothetical protein